MLLRGVQGGAVMSRAMMNPFRLARRGWGPRAFAWKFWQPTGLLTGLREQLRPNWARTTPTTDGMVVISQLRT